MSSGLVGVGRAGEGGSRGSGGGGEQEQGFVSIHILRTVVLDYGELLAYWFILHGCSTLEWGSRPVLFHNSLAGFTM